MTKEEAIKRFETLLLHVDTDCVMGMETTEAINMAIKALKQPEPCEDDPRADVYYLAEKIGIHQLYAFVVQLRGEPEPCEDAVSRKAAIDGLNDAVHEHNITDFDAVATILALPSVTPKQRIGKWIPADSQCGIRCSVCGVPVDDFCHSIDYIDLDYEPNFCPNCGEKME